MPEYCVPCNRCALRSCYMAQKRWSHASQLHTSTCKAGPRENQLFSRYHEPQRTRYDIPLTNLDIIIHNCAICWGGFGATKLHILVMLSPLCILC